MSWFVTDVEHDGPCPSMGSMTAFSSVVFEPGSERHRASYTAWVYPSRPRAFAREYAEKGNRVKAEQEGRPIAVVMVEYAAWVKATTNGRPVFVSDNPASDFAWINDAFWQHYGENPFGWSGRRIGDLFCGAQRNLYFQWKRFRKTPHTHDPFDDAMGNVEALEALFTQPPHAGQWKTPWGK